jgi:hypothetical protein
VGWNRKRWRLLPLTLRNTPNRYSRIKNGICANAHLTQVGYGGLFYAFCRVILMVSKFAAKRPDITHPWEIPLRSPAEIYDLHSFVFCDFWYKLCAISQCLDSQSVSTKHWTTIHNGSHPLTQSTHSRSRPPSYRLTPHHASIPQNAN